FDGKDDEVRVLTNPVLGFSSITVSAWVNPNKLGNQQYIINAPGIHLLANTGGNVSYGIRAGSGQASIFITSNTSLLQNAWNYVVGTYDSATGLYKVYINGNLTKVLDGKDNLSIEPLPTEVQSGLTIGNALPFAASLYFNGSIGEVAIWNKALTIEEIQAIYNAAGGLCKPTLGTCGDNQREFGEVCDGSEVGSATCSNVKGTGWSGSVTCTDNCQTFNTSQCVVASICGNGIVEPASEECDDDNNVNGDGCDLNCKKEVCGNGVIQSWIGETCDDGNIISEDNCSNACQIEQIQQPTDSCIGTTPANATLCQGDDTNLTANTTRTLVSACTLAGKCKYICNEGYTFNETINTCMLTQQQQQQAVCGDEVIDTDEQCDGTNLSGKVCTDFGWVESNQSGKYIGGTLSCANCKLNLSGCTKGQPETQNKKISLTDADTTDAFVTNITATETFSTEVTVYTVLYGANDKVLSIKSEKIEDGLTKDKTYTAIVNYAKTSVKKKSVLVYNTKQSPTVFGKFEKTY
ncbi:MAG: LamG-like jellyroll fold domain-containing protein, partial [Nanoarchaeota archaeon]